MRNMLLEKQLKRAYIKKLNAEIQPKNEVSQSIVEIDGNNSAVSKISKHGKVPYKMHHDYITARNRLDRAVDVANPYTCYNCLFFNKHLMIVYYLDKQLI
jgi:hypothetical protein